MLCRKIKGLMDVLGMIVVEDLLLVIHESELEGSEPCRIRGGAS